jgi:hypothetical protein
MTERCIAFACQEPAHSGSNLCYHHLPAIPLEEGKKKLELLKEELQALRNYQDILNEDWHEAKRTADEINAEWGRIKKIVGRKFEEIENLEKEIGNKQ